MLYCTLRREGSTTASILWKDLSTVRGYLNRAQAVHRAIPASPGEYIVVEIFRSEHPDHCYGRDTLVRSFRILRGRT